MNPPRLILFAMFRSVTTGTIFASRKLSYRDVLGAIAIFCNGAKGVSALRLMAKRCGVALRHLRDKGTVRAAQGPGQFMLWELGK